MSSSHGVEIKVYFNFSFFTVALGEVGVFDPQTVQPLASRYTNWATPVHVYLHIDNVTHHPLQARTASAAASGTVNHVDSVA